MEQGVIINGLRWSTRNVDKPGTFAANLEDAGMFYQYKRNKAWLSTGEMAIGWDKIYPGDYIPGSWTIANDPSPAGWRVPTIEELCSLLDFDKVSLKWTIINGINGTRFTDNNTRNSIFLPAVGYRNTRGILEFAGDSGFYWSGTEHSIGMAYNLFFYGGGAEWNWESGARYCGYCVRPVAR